MGVPQWHEEYDPISVETQVRGEIPLVGYDNYGLGLNLYLVQAWYSVACLEWLWWIYYSIFQVGKTMPLIDL